MTTTRRGCMIGASLFALGLFVTAPLPAQQGRQLLRIGMIELKSGGRYDHAEAAKIVSDAAKKSGSPWRDYWRTALFGETSTVVTVMPVTGMAMFDAPSVIAGLTGEQRARYTTLMHNSVAKSRYELAETMPEISLHSERSTMPKYARVTMARVIPGKQAEFEDAIRTILLPAMKKAGVKDYWVNRTLLGGPVGGYTTVLLFDKWEEVQSIVALEKMMGPEVFKQYLAKVASCVSGAENMVLELDQTISYRK